MSDGIPGDVVETGQDSNSKLNLLLADLLDVCFTATVFGCDSHWSREKQDDWYKKRDSTIDKCRKYLGR